MCRDVHDIVYGQIYGLVYKVLFYIRYKICHVKSSYKCYCFIIIELKIIFTHKLYKCVFVNQRLKRYI